MSSQQFLPKLRSQIDGRIDLSSQPRLCARERADDLAEGNVPDDQEVDVARGPEVAASRGTENECDHYFRPERRERAAEDVDQASGFGKHFPQLRKDCGLTIGLKVHLLASNCPPQQAGGGQLLQLALYSTDRGSCLPSDLAKVVGLVGVTQEPAEDAAAREPEEDRCRVGGGRSRRCSQDAYNCTHTENIPSNHRRPSDLTVSRSSRNSSMP